MIELKLSGSNDFNTYYDELTKTFYTDTQLGTLIRYVRNHNDNRNIYKLLADANSKLAKGSGKS